MHHLGNGTFCPKQRGVALVMAMIFLLLMNVLAVAAMNTSVLEERMAGNMGNSSVAFQAAESALRAGEVWLGSRRDKPVFDPANTSDGLHLASLTATPAWDPSTGVWSSSDIFTYSGLSGVAAQPTYIIEDLGEIPDTGGSLVLPTNYKSTGKNLFRITARATGENNTAVVFLQSVYEKRF
jgi:type IV pilus assembly protein PilX